MTKLHYRLLTLLALIFSLPCLLLISSEAHAQKNTQIFIVVEAPFSPKDSVGLVISDDKIKEIPQPQLERLASGRYLVSFKVKKQDLPSSNTTFSAAITSENGDIVFGNIRSFDTASVPPVLDICEPNIGRKSPALPDSIARYQRLVALRHERRNINRRRFLESLDEDFVKRLELIAKNFGLKDIDVTSESLSPLTLVQELSRVEHVLRNYLENHKNAAKK
ncbi:MAG: hypothetical protein ACOX2O_05885 [Bdellovibrionota bacterium]|jgi:hypothetical protein